MTLKLRFDAKQGAALTAGTTVAELLSRSWRRNAPCLKMPRKRLAQVVPLLLRTGSAALGWLRVRDSDLADFPEARELEAGYRQHAMEAVIHELQIQDVFRRMRAAGIEPLLLKGWAVARLYPNSEFRPYGDIDLWVSPRQSKAATAALRSSAEGDVYCVEIHSSFYKQYERTLDDVLLRSQLVSLGEVPIRVACLEDHLRFLCLHFLGHGAWRALWLCDIALAVESRAPDFDWDRCLNGSPRFADWIACTIGLAHQLLGAEVKGTPMEKRAKNLPRWLVPAVLRQWAAGAGMSGVEDFTFSLTRNLSHPARLIGALRDHWRNPIQATIETRGAFGRSPRMPYQIAAVLLRIPGLTGELLSRQRVEVSEL
ncbi:MAG: nucleotidyltransferase family protein [Pyrinomonadaceae bacterium]